MYKETLVRLANRPMTSIFPERRNEKDHSTLTVLMAAVFEQRAATDGHHALAILPMREREQSMRVLNPCKLTKFSQSLRLTLTRVVSGSRVQWPDALAMPR